jgi:hypothetical protein
MQLHSDVGRDWNYQGFVLFCFVSFTFLVPRLRWLDNWELVRYLHLVSLGCLTAGQFQSS